MQVDIIVHSTLNSSYLHFLIFTEDILTQEVIQKFSWNSPWYLQYTGSTGY